jgi:hypothetical protein
VSTKETSYQVMTRGLAREEALPILKAEAELTQALAGRALADVGTRAASDMSNVPDGSMTAGQLVNGVEWKSASLTALARRNSGAGLVWYRGNDDESVGAGVPVIYDGTYGDRISVASYGSSYSPGVEQYIGMFELIVQPKTDADNLDAMRYAEVEVWNNAGSAVLDTVRFPVPDRLHKNATSSSTDNLTRTRFYFMYLGTTSSLYNGTSPYHFNGFMRIRLYNVYGCSAQRDFALGSVAAGAARGTVQTGGSYNLGGSAPGGGSGGGGAGGTCMAPETLVLVGPTTTAPLCSLAPGDKVWTRPEAGGEMGYHEVAAVKLASNLRQRVALRDGRNFVCSVNHRICVRGVWRRADSLEIGEELDGQPSGIVRGIEYLSEGPVVQLSVPTASTYFGGDGLWQHNARKA